jgi:hypothetical protein
MGRFVTSYSAGRGQCRSSFDEWRLAHARTADIEQLELQVY